MKRRGGKREGAGRKKSPALTNVTRQVNQKHWKTNIRYIYQENRIFSTWRKVRAEGIFVNDSNFASYVADWFGAQAKTSFGTQSIVSSTRKTSLRTLFSTGQASVLVMTWVWFLNLDNREGVETKFNYKRKIYAD